MLPIIILLLLVHNKLILISIDNPYFWYSLLNDLFNLAHYTYSLRESHTILIKGIGGVLQSAIASSYYIFKTNETYSLYITKFCIINIFYTLYKPNKNASENLSGSFWV